MNRRGSRLVQFIQGLGVVSRGFFIFAAVCAAYLLVSPFSWSIGTTDGLLASAVAACLCLIGAVTALVLNFVLRDPRLALQSLLAGMMLRMGVPLLLGLVLHTRVDWLAQQGMLYYLVVFYFVTLAVEISLTLPAALPAEVRSGKS